MTLSRRQFLGSINGAALGAVSAMRGATSRSSALTARAAACERVILDLGRGCALRESLNGYRTALAGAGFVVAAAPDAIRRAKTIVVPGCAHLGSRVIDALADSLDDRGLVLIESAAGFAGLANASEFDDHRHQLRAHFGLELEPPVNLWKPRLDSSAESGSGAARVPYIDYSWPVSVKVRDFSRVVPLSAQSRVGAGTKGEIIGWVDGWPVAVKRAAGKRGKGMLVFLGSPLGPALGWGDREARHWLRTLVAASSRSADLRT